MNGNDPRFGWEPWVSDGTAAGTRLVRNVEMRDLGSAPMSLVRAGDAVFFSADDAEHGRELWRARGDDVALVRDFVAGGAGWAFDGGAPAGDVLYFGAPSDHGRELWRSDGSSEGTFEVRDLEPGPDSSNPVQVTPYEDGIVFATIPAGDVWRSDGTAEGTVRLWHPEHALGTDLWPSFGFLDARLFFTAQDGADCALWASDGSMAGTAPVADTRICSPLAAAGGRLFFAGDDDLAGTEPWRSDGSAEGTARVADLGSGDSSPSRFFPFGDRVIFAVESSRPPRLWISDGSEEGTAPLAAAEVHSRSANGTGFVESGGRVFFSGFAPQSSAFVGELWRSNGTAPGTRALRPTSIQSPRGIECIAAVGERLYFGAFDDAHGREPWVSDGTDEGTHPVQDIVEGAESSEATDFVAAGTNIYFVATDPAHGAELWVLPCTGDCTADERVSPDDFRSAVEIALGRQSLEACAPVNANADDEVTIDELVRAARNLAQDCPRL